MSTDLHPGIHIALIIVIFYLAAAAPIAGIGLSVILVVANWKSRPPWRITYIVVTLAAVLLYTWMTPAYTTAH